MNIISTTYYRVTTFMHIYPKIFVLRLFHENIYVITIDSLLLLCMLFLICMVLNICNFIQRTEQVPFELDISAVEDYILLLLMDVHVQSHPFK